MNLLRALLVFLLLSSPLFALVNENNDFQVWIYDSYEQRFHKDKWGFRVETEFRYGDHASLMYLTYAQFLLLYQPCKWIEFAPGYRHLHLFLSSRDRWETFYIPISDLTVKFETTRKWKWVDRNRVEYLIPEEGDINRWVYRNRLRLIFPWKLSPYPMTPMIDDEIFFLEYRGFIQNRFSVGVLSEITEYLKLRSFYMLRHFKFIDGWRHHHIIGFYFHFRF